MYLKLIRNNHSGGNFCRGKLYSVHFQPNEKGGYNECLTPISDAYEISSGDVLPLTLIYRAEVRGLHGHMRLSFGMGHRRSLLCLTDRNARKRFFGDVLDAIRQREELRIDVSNPERLPDGTGRAASA